MKFDAPIGGRSVWQQVGIESSQPLSALALSGEPDAKLTSNEAGDGPEVLIGTVPCGSILDRRAIIPIIHAMLRWLSSAPGAPI